MTTIEKQYRSFCERIALECEVEANRYERHPQRSDEEYQFVRALRERCKQFRQQVERIDAAYGPPSEVHHHAA